MENETKIKLLRIIEKDSRISIKDLAIQLGQSEDDVTKTLAKMEKEGIVAGYHSLINWEKTGIEKVTALIHVKVCPQKDDGFSRIADKICKYTEVYDVTLISGDYDFLVTIEGKTLQEVADFVHTKLAPIDGVVSTSTNFILQKYKEHGKKYNNKNNKERIVVTP